MVARRSASSGGMGVRSSPVRRLPTIFTAESIGEAPMRVNAAARDGFCPDPRAHPESDDCNPFAGAFGYATKSELTTDGTDFTDGSGVFLSAESEGNEGSTPQLPVREGGNVTPSEL